MLEVLDGVGSLKFDYSHNKKRIEAMHDKMSETCDIMASKQTHSYRKSDDALLDKNSLGPVYYKILKQRRRRGLAYKKEILPVKSVQTDFPEVSDTELQPPSVDSKSKGKRLVSDLSRVSLGRYSSVRSLKPEKDYSLIDTSFLIRSID